MRMQTDVLVVGGGVAGVCAAAAAARAGAKTVLVERNSFLGGAATAAAVSQFMGWQTAGGKQIIAGLGEEIVRRLVEAGGSPGPDTGMLSTGTIIDRVVFDPETLKVVLDELVTDSGAQPLFHASVSSVKREGSRISEVSLLTKSGDIVVEPQIVIDASGDLEVLYRAGCEMLPLKEGEQLQPASLYFKMGPGDLKAYEEMPYEDRMEIARRGVDEGALGRFAISCYPVPGTNDAWFNVTRIAVDGTDAFALSRAEIEGRRQALAAAKFIAANVPAFSEAKLTGFAPQLGIRQTRRIKGRTVVSEEDLRSGRRFPDTIAIAAFPIDVHEANGADVRLERVGGDDHYYSIPLSALIPEELDNALVAGRGVSADQAAFGALRIMPQAMAMGQAAGVAAALASREGIAVARVDLTSLQEALRGGGAILEAEPA